MLDLFPGPENTRLREAMLRLHTACGQLRYVGSSIMQSVAAAKRMPLEEWETYMYHSIGDGTAWLCKLETSMLEAGSELRVHMRAREQHRLEDEERKAEAEYAKLDLQRFEEHLFNMSKAEESSDAGRSRGELLSRGSEEGRGKARGREDTGTVGIHAGEEVGKAGLVDPKGSDDGSALSQARGILGK